MRPPTPAEQGAAQQWDGIAETWAANLAGQLDVINESFGIPSFLAFLGEVRSRKLLDAGCGEGRSSRHLARLGATVTGVDISPAMIEHARAQESPSPLGIAYAVAPSADLHLFAGDSFDTVTSVMALMDTADLAGSLHEFARVLRPGGELCIMVRHPCFFTAGYSLLANRAGLAVADYFRGDPYLERWRFPAADATTTAPFVVTRYPHTLADYLDGLLKAGLHLSGISEPRPSEEVCRNIANLRFWQKHASLYLFLRARKTAVAPGSPVVTTIPSASSSSATSVADYIRAMPKAELHLHLEGSLRPATLLALAERNRVKLPCSTAEELETRLQSFRNFREFIPALLLGVHCLRRPEDFRDAILALGRELAAQHVRYAEISWTPQFYRRLGLSFDALLEGLNAGRREVEAQWGLRIAWIVDLVRSVPAPAGEVTAWACADPARAGGVVALGLGGPEAAHPAAPFAEHFRYARERGLPANPHAGEGAGPESIRTALDLLGAQRLGHGVRACEDPALVALLAERGTVLEVCPTSNVRLGIYPSYAEHPLARLAAAGCTVTIHSDDPVLFRTTLTEEYQHAVADCGLPLPALKESVVRAVMNSYQEDHWRRATAAQFQVEFERLHQAAQSTPS